MSCEKIIIIPSSPSESQIFTLGSCSTNYNTGDYDHGFANGLVSPQEVTQAINDIQQASQPFVNKIWLASLLLVLGYFILVIIAVAIRIILFGLEGYLGLIVMVIIITICTTPIDAIYKKRLVEIAQVSKDTCSKMLDGKDKDSFESRRLRWFLLGHFPLLQKIMTSLQSKHCTTHLCPTRYALTTHSSFLNMNIMKRVY